MECIRTCDSPLLVELLRTLPQAARGVLLDYFQILKDALIEEYTAKFIVWRPLPYSVIGIASVDTRKAKKVARDCLAEWESCPHQQAAHRVAHRVLGNPALRNQIDRFATTDSPLSDFPVLSHVVSLYALSPLVERSIEGEHAKIEHVIKLCGTSPPATVCARFRSAHLLDLLSAETFRSWCLGRWSTHVFRQVVAPLQVSTRGWHSHQFLELIYLCGTAQQHGDVSKMSDALTICESTVGSAVGKASFAPSRAQDLCLQWWQKRLACGRMFCLPADLCQLVDFCVPPDRDIQEPVVSDILPLVGCDDLVVEAPTPNDDLTLFRVVNTSPSRRFLLHPWHLGRKPTCIRVALFYRTFDVESRFVFSPSGQVGNLDLETLSGAAFTDVWQSLTTWGNIAMGSSLQLCESVVRSATMSLPHLPFVPRVAEPAPAGSSRDGPQGGDVVPRATSASTIAAPLLVVARKGGIVEDGRFVQVQNVAIAGASHSTQPDMNAYLFLYSSCPSKVSLRWPLAWPFHSPLFSMCRTSLFALPLCSLLPCVCVSGVDTSKSNTTFLVTGFRPC